MRSSVTRARPILLQISSDIHSELRWDIRIYRIWPEVKYICIWLYWKRVLGCRPRVYLKCIWPEAKY